MTAMLANGSGAPVLSLVTFPVTVKISGIDVVVAVVVETLVVAAVVVEVEFDGPVDVFLVHATTRNAAETDNSNAVPNRIVCFIRPPTGKRSAPHNTIFSSASTWTS